MEQGAYMILFHIQCLLSQLKMFVGVLFKFSFTNLKTGILLCSFFRNFQSGWWTAPCIQKHPNMGPLIAPHMLDPRVVFFLRWDCSVLHPQQNQGERNGSHKEMSFWRLSLFPACRAWLDIHLFVCVVWLVSSIPPNKTRIASCFGGPTPHV